MKTFNLLTIALIAINVTCSQSSLTSALVKRGQSPIKDDNGIEIDLNMPAKDEEQEHYKSSNKKNKIPNKQREYIPHTYATRAVKKKHSENSGAIRSRKFRERRRKDPIKLQQYLLGERMRNKKKSKEPASNYPGYLFSLERKNEINQQQSLQLAEYREKRRASKKRYYDKQRALKMKLGNVEQEKQ